MASLLNRRITAILLQEKVEELFAQVAPLRMVACEWTLDGLDEDLPPEGEVKIVLDGFMALEVPALNVRASLRDVEESTEGENYALPNPPQCGAYTSGLFDGSATFDGATSFDGEG